MMVERVEEHTVMQRAYVDLIALENGRLAREGVELARMINDKEASEQRLTDHIKNLDANVSLSLPLSRLIHVLIRSLLPPLMLLQTLHTHTHNMLPSAC
jgi:hypothetical protein